MYSGILELIISVDLALVLSILVFFRQHIYMVTETFDGPRIRAPSVIAFESLNAFT